MILYISSCTYPPALNIMYYDSFIDSLLPAPPGKPLPFLILHLQIFFFSKIYIC